MTFNWFIPARRAVVTASTTYFALIDAWCAELERCEQKLCAWYSLDADGFETGIAYIRAWQSTFFPEGVSVLVPRDGEVTVSTIDVPFAPRLWKGALRVLIESQNGPSEPAGAVFDPPETLEPPLLLSEQREIENPDAPLLIGDVVEMPLFKFLGAAGNTSYGDLPYFDQVHRFNPEGSYLLGTSLAATGDEDPPLHDNLTAMRFQTLLDCMVGSFYASEPTITHDRAVRVSIPDALVPAAPTDGALGRLIDEVRRVYLPVSFDAGHSLFHQELDKSEADPGWASVASDVKKRVRQWAEMESEGNPPPRAYLWRIQHRFGELAAIASPTPAEEAEAEALMDLHDRVVTRLQEWVLELDGLLESAEWQSYAHVAPDFGALAGELAIARSIGRPCPWLCPSDHARIEISALVKALASKLANLEAMAGGADAPGGASGPAIYARGMVYAGVLYSAAKRRYYEGADAWHFYTNQWCRDSEGRTPRCMPYRYGLERLPRHQPVTPGSVCSDTTLLLLNYMIRNHGESGVSSWGKGSVSASMRKKAAYAIKGHYEYIPDEDVAALAPAVTREERLARLEGLIEKVHARLRDIAPATSYWSALFPLVVGDPRWSEVGPKTHARLPRYTTESLWGVGAPYGHFYYLSVGMKAHAGAALAVLTEHHDRLMESTRTFSELLDALIADPDWKAFEDVYDFGKHADHRATVASASARGFSGQYGDNHAIARRLGQAVRLLHIGLDKKRKALEKLAADPDRVKGSVGGRKDLSEFLGDVNSVAFSGHEWAIVRVHPADRLLEEPGPIPRAGRISAFHPLSGQPYFDERSHPSGQFYVFEQREQLFRFTHPHTGRRHCFLGAAPFCWYPVPNNEFLIYPANGKVKFTDPGRSTDKRLVSITRLVDADRLRDIQARAPAPRPLLVHPTSKPASEALRAQRAVAYERLVTNGPAMYASRALPFPTMHEARHAFAAWDEVKAHLDELGA